MSGICWLDVERQFKNSNEKAIVRSLFRHRFELLGAQCFRNALSLLRECREALSNRSVSLACLLLDELESFASTRYPNPRQLLTLELKHEAVSIAVDFKNVALTGKLCRIFCVSDDKMAFVPLINDLLSKRNYTEACTFVMALDLQRQYSLEDIVIPLIFQDKANLVEVYVRQCPDLQLELVKYLDLLSVGTADACNQIIRRLYLSDVRMSMLKPKTIGKLVSRFIKMFDIPPEVCPNLITYRSIGALKYLITRKYIEVPTLRSVVMCIMKNLDHLEDKYLKHILSDRKLYEECDVHVKRQIWQENQGLYGDEVTPLLTQYAREKEEQLLLCQEASTNFFNLSPKQRRQSAVAQKLVLYVGKNVQLYDMVLQFLHTLFLRTHNVHYCTLRAELLMALHDLEVQDIKIDPCHKFTWCLDACIREKTVDGKRARELQGFLDGIRRGQEQLLGNLSMILCDPYAVNFLANSAMKILSYLINNEGLPRDQQVLLQLLRMLALGLSAWDMMNTQVYKEPKMDVQVVTKFLPALMSLMVDDQIRSLNSRLPQDDRETAITTIEHSGPPPDAYVYIQENGVASILAMYYTLHTARQKDRQGLMRVLGTLSICHGDRAFADPFLHNLVALLTPMAEEFAAEDFCTVIFDEFFLGNLMKGNVARHLMRLLWNVYHKLPPTRLDGVIKSLQQMAQHNEGLQSFYQQLQERVQNYHPVSTQSSLDKLESPLLGVPKPI